MVIESFVGAVIGGAVVWIFGEITHRKRSMEGHRAAVGQVLSDLAEIRHRLDTISTVGVLCNKLGHVTPEAERAIIRRMLVGIVPPMPDLHQKLETALRLIAATDPDLAFRMRSKDQIESVLMRLQNMLLIHAEEHDAFHAGEAVDGFLIKTATNMLDEAILELAKMHGEKALRDFTTRVNRWNDQPTQFAEFKKEIMQRVPQLAAFFEVLDAQPAPQLPQS